MKRRSRGSESAHPCPEIADLKKEVHCMKVLLIGGTGPSVWRYRKGLIKEGHELWLVNRGNRNHGLPEGYIYDTGRDSGRR